MFSQEKVAELCNLHQTYISDIECCQRNISLKNIQKMLMLFKLNHINY